LDVDSQGGSLAGDPLQKFDLDWAGRLRSRQAERNGGRAADHANVAIDVEPSPLGVGGRHFHEIAVCDRLARGGTSPVSP